MDIGNGLRVVPGFISPPPGFGGLGYPLQRELVLTFQYPYS